MPKIVDREKKKDEIARIACDLFIQKGYAGTGMREIAAALAISKTQLYHYFQNKEELFNHCFELFLETARGFALKINPNDPIEKKLAALVSYYASVISEFGKEMCLITDYLRTLSDKQKQSSEIIQRHRKGILSALSTALALNRDQTIVIHQQLLGAMVASHYSGQKLNQKQLVSTLLLLIKH